MCCYFFAYCEALLQVHEKHNIIFISRLHRNQSSIEKLFSRMRNLDKNRTDLYGGEGLHKNVMNDSYDSNKKRKIGSSLYSSEWMINVRTCTNEEEVRIGDTFISNSTRIKLLIVGVLNSLPEHSQSTSILPNDFEFIGLTFGSLFKEALLLMTLQNRQNLQRCYACNTFLSIISFFST